MQFNQTNNNAGDVNNAITGKGNVVQTAGTGNKVQADQPKESFSAALWKKAKACWKWVAGKP